VVAAHATLDRAYALLDSRLTGGGWAAGPAFTLADCAAGPALFYARVVHRWDEQRLAGLTRYFTELTARPSVARVIDEAREYRDLFPLPWPNYVR
jgi:glutathione S-transferase